MWFIHDDKNYQVADKLYFYDRFLAATVLKLFPDSVKPNYVTMFRFLATPLVVLVMYREQYFIGLLVFLLVAFTDAIDGSLARTRNQITNWGKIYDPLADKLLIAAMIFTIVLRYIDFWSAMLIIGLEIMIVAAAWWRKHNGYSVEANLWGKIKMVLQVTGVVLLMLTVAFDIESLLPFGKGAFYLAIAFALVSLLTYGI